MKSCMHSQKQIDDTLGSIVVYRLLQGHRIVEFFSSRNGDKIGAVFCKKRNPVL